MKYYYSIQLDKRPTLSAILIVLKQKNSFSIVWEKNILKTIIYVQEKRDLVWECMLKI